METASGILVMPTGLSSDRVTEFVTASGLAFNLLDTTLLVHFPSKKEKDSDVMLVELIKNNHCPSNEELEEDDDVLGEEEFWVDHFDKFPTRSELAYHKYLMCAPIPSMTLSDPVIVGGNPLNLKIPWNMGNIHVGRAYIDLDSP
ncbi:hypothetical protein Tco_0389217 [Tanacetum coccineum]